MPLDRPSSHMQYRKDIDGLRALAVSLVVIFHVFPEWLKGGFIGVDIFFVISGFLISKIIIGDLNKNSFSFSNFYFRRVRRIFPALIIVLSFSIVFGWFLFFPDEYRLLGKHIFSSGIFVQNLNLLSEVGYFNEAAETKPLLHLWSLGIEEQFYLIWPLLLWLGHKLKIDSLFLIGTLGISSFILNLFISTVNPNFAFFSPLTRFWELLIGAALAYQSLKKQAWIKSGGASKIDRSLIGLGLIFSGIILTSPSSIFPGWIALLPTLGAVFIISAGPGGFVNQQILSRRFMVGLGLISYPLYLWHWVLLTFARIIESGEVSVTYRLFILVISIVLSVLTYYFIEKPIQSNLFLKQKNTGLIALMTLLIFIGHNFYTRDGLAFRMYAGKNSESILSNPADLTQEKSQNGYIEGFDCQSPSDQCAPINSSKKKIIIWGDSHAQMLLHGLREHMPIDWAFSIITQPGCKPVFIKSKQQIHNECDQINYFATQQIETIRPDIVLLAQRDQWKTESVDYLYKNIKAAGVKKILYLGKSPEWTANLSKIVARGDWLGLSKYSKAGLNLNALDLDEIARKEFRGSKDKIYLNLIQLFCTDDGCLVYLGDDAKTGITSFDTNHLSPKASSFAVKELVLKHLQ